jgi:hypothetical protein
MVFRAFKTRVAAPIVLLALAMGAAWPAPAFAEVQKLVYEVRHPTYGRIGTYTNTVEKESNRTTVTTEGRIRVSILGIVLYRQDFDRIERWEGERLVSFQGRTTTNGNSVDVKGEAEGERFAVSSPSGMFMAPATVKLANPWSEGILKGSTMLTPDRGLLEDVKVRSAEMAELAIKGEKTRARRYEIARVTGEKRYEVWINEGGTPVMFNVGTRRGTVFFTLMS